MLPLALLIAAAVLALWLFPAARRGPPAMLARAAATGLVAALGIFFLLRGRLFFGAAFLGTAALLGAWRRMRDLVAPRQPLAAMSVEEAWAVLDLKPGASTEDIRTAHRALIRKLHPDSGGNTYLAAKLNQARDVLLRQAR